MLTFPTLIKGTITGLRISAVDGTAFLDNCSALLPYADGNHRIEIYDASGRMLKGVLKAAGTGETLGDELQAGWTNSDSLPYETFTSSGLDITEAAETGVSGRAAGNSAMTAGHLVKFGFSVTVNSGNISMSYYGKSATSAIAFAGQSDRIQMSAGAQSGYQTLYVVNVYCGFRSEAAVNFSISGYTNKQVLTPSSSGATIVSAKGGAIYNFASKDASFTYNAASYRYAIYDTLKVSRPTRYMGVSTHNI
jgi:hypothetical protein